MPALQIKDCPADVYEELRACASRENRSISQQALTIIETYLGLRKTLKPSSHAEQKAADALIADTPDFVAKRKAVFERIAALPSIPTTKDAPSGAELLKQIREEEAR